MHNSYLVTEAGGGGGGGGEGGGGVEEGGRGREGRECKRGKLAGKASVGDNPVSSEDGNCSACRLGFPFFV